MKNILLLASLLAVASGCSHTPVPGQYVTIGGRTLAVRVADEASEQIAGLSGVESLTDDEGMLFVFGDKRERIFWMKGMLVPIDILWIDGARVVGIERAIPAPAPGTPDTDLLRYTSPQPVDYVLEVAAGFTDRYGVKPGDAALIDR